jgi:UDP-N-acetylmuramate--alanine ligase
VFRKGLRIHFVGIGGIGMSGIAELLLNLGYRVSGSDLRRSASPTGCRCWAPDPCRTRGGERPEDGHVVVSPPRSSRQPGVAGAPEEDPVIPRAEMLAELMRMKYDIMRGRRQDDHHIDGGTVLRRRLGPPLVGS